MTATVSALAELGWHPFFQAQLDLDELKQGQPCRVLAVHRGLIDVLGIDGSNRLPSGQFGGDITVGDWLVHSEASHKFRVLERRSLFKRRAAGTARNIQLIAANVDTLLIVSSCNQDFKVARLERFLALAHEASVQPVIVLTKADECSDPDAFRREAEAISPGLVVELVDARDPDSTWILDGWCGIGQTLAVIGTSGVGKSTLANTLTGHEIETQAARADDDRGRHTTTGRSMYRLRAGGWLIDTPGMRELQLLDVSEGIDAVFDDLVSLSAACRFTDCRHETEPGCAVQAAIAEGTLEPARLKRYQKLLREERLNRESISERRARDRAFSRHVAKVMREKAKRKRS